MVDCFGDLIGGVFMIILGGMVFYFYLWFNSNNDVFEFVVDLIGVFVGIYIGVVIDEWGCMDVVNVMVINVYLLIMVIVMDIDLVFCKGDFVGSIDLNVAGGV